MYLTAIAFVVVAFLYASVGFGGGSSYTALLIESGLPWESVAPLSLICNIVVVTGGVYHYSRRGHLNFKLAVPLIAASIPAAFLGGFVRLQQPTFLLFLGLALLVSGILLLLDKQWFGTNRNSASSSNAGLAGLGAIFGGLAGITGIGGGIYLAPVLHFFRVAPAQTIAATSSLFILVNSLSGLAGQLSKLGTVDRLIVSAEFLVLPVAVLVGGQLGSRLGANRLPATPIRRLTGLVVLVVAMRILWQLL